MNEPADWLRELGHSWPLLVAQSATEISTTPLGLDVGPAPIRVAVNGTGSRHLLIPVGEEDVAGDEAEGPLLLRIRTYTFGRVPAHHLDVSCARPDLFDLFDEVLADVLIAAGAEPHRPAAAAVGVVARWRTLLSTHRARRLTLVGQMAMFAELTVLDVVSRGFDLDITWWRGPLREPHDIRLPGCALEVKALGAAATDVEIHGIKQLEEPADVPLALVLATVVEADDGATLPELAERISGRATDRGEMRRRFAAAGYSEADAPRYTERFRVAELAHVPISADVPRIVPASFGSTGAPAGIAGVTYRIAVAVLDPHAARGEAALVSWVGDVS
ncbi:PD-(D/E)XK motif protein [Sporichthya sp.]|uniref:PD-(D/E)XK motif protein n=1 Tax=Sporichthya sp. TaxID=65475 RepID=UPI0018075C52|nr:PD-(D/E)XK motif protein [Sporichthya sp.]MBA3744496.1 PD-(D/E)XK motif protein [Sporichthya sp.]